MHKHDNSTKDRANNHSNNAEQAKDSHEHKHCEAEAIEQNEAKLNSNLDDNQGHENNDAALNNDLSNMMSETEALQKQLEELKDQMLRTAADAQNSRKRAEKEIADARVYAISSFAKEMLSVCDNLERSLDISKEQAEKISSEHKEIFNSLSTGVELTLNMLIKALESHKISKIEAKPGDKFNPHLHQAMFEQPAEGEQDAGLIAAIIQNGYMISDRVLRPVLVGITKKAD